ncbi:imm11 family protein [Agarilytica rhodophyticola]|uniref:imm11 family protein n=1 Tax=Agarilytica rhodophyticola TaxID=1737490 RepID=UPI000B3469AC|nr:DUF1629 domain-containing protein [Agarilytica rhodophyticola]
MLYVIHSDEYSFLSLVFDDDEIDQKLGDNYLIQADPTPISLKQVWKPLNVSFVDVISNRNNKPIPDIHHNFGRLFLSSEAAEILSPILENKGELLSVNYGNNKNGFIFNPLILAEDSAGLNKKLSIKNNVGDIQSLFFHEDKLEGCHIFKTEFDNYMGVYCDQEFKELVEKHSLTGVTFGNDLGNIFPPDPTGNTSKPKGH